MVKIKSIISPLAQHYYETRVALGILPRSEEERKEFELLDWQMAERKLAEETVITNK